MLFLRPDARAVWKNPEVIERFSRYNGIIKGNRYAKYLIAKKVDVESVEGDLTQLWERHQHASKEFRDLLQKVDANEIVMEDLEDSKVSYVSLKIQIALKMLESCQFCERRCKKNRISGEKGVCKVGSEMIVSSAFLHTGEEAPLVPSGTIFASGCTFRCVFCQNHTISQEWYDRKRDRILDGVPKKPHQIASICRELQRRGALNINWVGGDCTPNIHVIMEVLKKLDINITMLWNSNMYLTTESMELLLDVMDFWLPDLKYREDDFALRVSRIKNYWEIATRNIKMSYDSFPGEMIIRHLCMPGRIEADTIPVLEWCVQETPRAMVNIMGQYRPQYRILKQKNRFRDIARRVTQREMDRAKQKADELGILWKPVS